MDLEIDVSNRCNIQCRMCYFSFDQTFHAKPVHMRPEMFGAIADVILPHARAVMLSLGSEPLMSPDFVRILELAARYRDELVRWGSKAVARIEGFYSDNPSQPERDVHFTFLKPDDGEVVVTPSIST